MEKYTHFQHIICVICFFCPGIDWCWWQGLGLSFAEQHTQFWHIICLQLLSVPQQPVSRFFVALLFDQSLLLVFDREELGWTTCGALKSTSLPPHICDRFFIHSTDADGTNLRTRSLPMLLTCWLIEVNYICSHCRQTRFHKL